MYTKVGNFSDVLRLPSNTYSNIFLHMHIPFQMRMKLYNPVTYLAERIRVK